MIHCEEYNRLTSYWVRQTSNIDVISPYKNDTDPLYVSFFHNFRIKNIKLYFQAQDKF